MDFIFPNEFLLDFNGVDQRKTGLLQDGSVFKPRKLGPFKHVEFISAK